MSVTPFKNISEQPDEDVVSALSDALDLARRGELRSVAIVGDLTGNMTFTDFSTNDSQKLIGMLAFLQFMLSARMRENTR